MSSKKLLLADAKLAQVLQIKKLKRYACEGLVRIEMFI